MKPAANPLIGIGLVLCAMAILPLIDVCAKFLGQQGVPILQMVWARFFFGSVFTLPFAVSTAGKAAFRPVNPIFNAGRAGALIAGTFFFFLSLRYLPIADTLAIFFVQPIIVTALSPLLLREHVGIRRWITVAIGFIGVLIIIRPGLQEFNMGVVYALLAGFCSALYIIITRHLTGKAIAIVTTFQTSVIGAIGLSAALPLYWMNVSMNQMLLLVLLGAIAIAGHFLITKAYDHAEASLLSPFSYTEMIMAVAAGWYFFGDFPDAYTFLGVAILISCAIYISVRERKRGIAAPPETEPIG
ncbi:MAG: DMT family transporter [Rhizobiales bacterium]|nr:DMT family transporter [Hyphomicrobiales bacterium]